MLKLVLIKMNKDLKKFLWINIITDLYIENLKKFP